MQSGDDSLWESFPRILKSQEGVRRYINAFQAPFQELPSLSTQHIYTLRVCSLLVIPPPIGRMVPRGFPADLTELNLSGWANLVQDMAAGLQALLPRLCLDLGSQVIALLQLLEAATGVGFCHHCCHPRPHCTCMGASQPAPPPHIVEPDCPAGSRVWSDLLLQRSNRSEYFHGRYAWIRGTSSRPHPSRFLHLEHTSSGGPFAPRATGISTIPASHGEGHPNESHYRKAGSGAAGSGAAGPTAAGSSDGTTLAPATPILRESASNPISTGSATTK